MASSSVSSVASISSSPSPTSSSEKSSSSSSSPSSSSTTPNATSASSGSSSASSSATSSSSAAQSTSSTNSASSVSTVAQVLTTDSGGVVETITSTSFVTSTVTPSAQGNSSNSFFSNTGAVAGVFSVVGLVVVALVIALIINAVRRRRAQKFDRDVADAAAEAAASSRSPFDEYAYANSGGSGGGGGGGGGYGYSDNSHGTYQMPPLSPQNGAYGMTEMSQFDPYAAGAASLAASAVGRSRSRKESEPGIAGVGAGPLAREPSARAPYHAFAGPGPQAHDLQTSNGTRRSMRGNPDVLQAAGLVAPPGGVGGGGGGAFVTRNPSEATQHTLSQFGSGRSQIGSLSSGGHHPATLQPGYPVESYYPQRHDSLSPDPFAGYPPSVSVSVPSNPLPNPHDTPPSPPSVPEHHSDPGDEGDEGDSGSPTALRSDEQRMSYQDDADYSQGNRVLRVANE